MWSRQFYVRIDLAVSAVLLMLLDNKALLRLICPTGSFGNVNHYSSHNTDDNMKDQCNQGFLTPQSHVQNHVVVRSRYNHLCTELYTHFIIEHKVTVKMHSECCSHEVVQGI